MKQFGKFVALATLSAIFSTGVVVAQDDHRQDQDHHDQDHHDNHQYVRHNEWKKGYHMDHNDWDRGERVDYRTYHLRQPPRGYEWRQVDGNYVMAAVATGVIATVVAANAGR